MSFKKLFETIKFLFLLLFFFTLPANIFATKDSKSEDKQDNQETQTEEPAPKSGNSIKAYSTGTIYKEIANEPSKRRKAGDATNDDDPGFPGDPGQGLPVGDGLIFMLGFALVYIINKNLNLKKNHEYKKDSL